MFLNSHQSGVLKALAWLVPRESAVSARCVHIQPYTLSLHAHKVHACLAVTRYLHFCQTDQDLLHATAVTRGWNGYQSKSQHRKLTLEKKKILPPLLQGCEPTTFQSWVWCSNHCTIPTPCSIRHHMVTNVQKGIRQIWHSFKVMWMLCLDWLWACISSTCSEIIQNSKRLEHKYLPVHTAKGVMHAWIKWMNKGPKTKLQVMTLRTWHTHPYTHNMHTTEPWQKQHGTQTSRTFFIIIQSIISVRIGPIQTKLVCG